VIDEVRQWHGSSKAMMGGGAGIHTFITSANSANTDVSYTNIFSVQFTL
jgi:hypothetical protein